jgi:hypothetical protein
MFSIRTSGSDINRSTRWANIVDIFISWSFPYNKVFMVFDQDSRILGSKETQLPKNAPIGNLGSAEISRRPALIVSYKPVSRSLL